MIGDRDDPHVQSIVGRLPASGLVVVDAGHLDSVVRRLDSTRTTLVDVAGDQADIHPDDRCRGWIRRLAPAGWDHGVRLGSRRAAVLASRLTLLAALVRDPALTWLTGVDDLFAAENKIVQYRTAITAGIRVPEFAVSIDRSELSHRLGEPFVLKPLGPGDFVDEDGQPRVVFAREMREADLGEVDLLDAPFLAQRRVRADLHLRVVTVAERAWVAELDATGLPLDWRSHGPAHSSFRASSQWKDVERAAVSLAAALRTGFTCQDWVVDDEGPIFLDLNPGGQWLFLPTAVAESASAALAAWLRAGE